MGRMLIETVLNDSGVKLSGAFVRAGSPQLGQDAGAFLGKETGVILTDDIERVFAEADFLIDFTRPEPARWCISKLRCATTSRW